jgi:hypothetical protein
MPAMLRRLAKGSIPVLSETEIRAVLIWRGPTSNIDKELLSE